MLYVLCPIACTLLLGILDEFCSSAQPCQYEFCSCVCYSLGLLGFLHFLVADFIVLLISPFITASTSWYFILHGHPHSFWLQSKGVCLVNIIAMHVRDTLVKLTTWITCWSFQRMKGVFFLGIRNQWWSWVINRVVPLQCKRRNELSGIHLVSHWMEWRSYATIGMNESWLNIGRMKTREIFQQNDLLQDSLLTPLLQWYVNYFKRPGNFTAWQIIAFCYCYLLLLVLLRYWIGYHVMIIWLFTSPLHY